VGEPSLRRIAETKRPTSIGDLLRFLRQRRKWWLLPIVSLLLFLGFLLLFAGTTAGPFVYTLF
jgi:hypothetical protein